jgi:hypothetical protein
MRKRRNVRLWVRVDSSALLRTWKITSFRENGHPKRVRTEIVGERVRGGWENISEEKEEWKWSWERRIRTVIFYCCGRGSYNETKLLLLWCYKIIQIYIKASFYLWLRSLYFLYCYRAFWFKRKFNNYIHTNFKQSDSRINIMRVHGRSQQILVY